VRKQTLIALLLLAVLSTVQAGGANGYEELMAQVTRLGAAFKDLKATVVVKDANRRELEKMGKLFAETYQFKKASVCFKSPDKLKLNGALGMMKVEFITSADERHVRIPSMHFRKKENISDQQEKRVTSLDVGVVTDTIWKIYNVSLERVEKDESGFSVYVLRLRTDTSKKSQLIWVDGNDLRLLRRDKLFNDDSLKVRTVYSEHKQVGGVWIPARADVYNGDGKLAASTETRDMIANTTIEDKEFE
jgi:outer membrane lipoprotein-sorting protein